MPSRTPQIATDDSNNVLALHPSNLGSQKGKIGAADASWQTYPNKILKLFF